MDIDLYLGLFATQSFHMISEDLEYSATCQIDHIYGAYWPVLKLEPQSRVAKSHTDLE